MLRNEMDAHHTESRVLLMLRVPSRLSALRHITHGRVYYRRLIITEATGVGEVVVELVRHLVV